MLTKGAIGNLVNRYRAVLKKCNLMNTFGSLAVASMLVMGGASLASAAAVDLGNIDQSDAYTYVPVNHNDVISGSVTADSGFIFQGNNVETFNATKMDAEINTDQLSVIGSTTKFTGFTVSSEETLKNVKSIYIESTGLRTGIKIDGTIIFDKSIILAGTGDARVEILQGGSMTIGNLISQADKAKVQLNDESSEATIKSIDVQKGSLNLEVLSNKSTGNATFKIGTINVASGARFNASVYNNDQPNIEVAGIGGNLTINLAEDAIADLGGVKNNDWRSDKISINADKITVNVDDINSDSHVYLSKEGTDLDKTSVTVSAGGENNSGDVSADLEKMADIVQLTSNTDTDQNGQVPAEMSAAAGATLELDENDLFGAATAKVAEDGTVEKGSIKTKRNTLMDAVLQQASVTTLALDKLLTNDVRKRLGDIRSDKNESGVWMRWDGGKLKGDGLTNNFNTIQIGGDTKVGKNCRLGVAGSFTHGDAEFARGTAELEGFSLATYATWMGDNGMFADVVARLGQFNNEMNVEGRKGKLDNRVFSLSGEYGWRFNVCEQFFVEPQAELAYTYVSSDSLELGDAKYLIDSVDSLTGRLGLVAGWNLPNDMGNVYARASVLQQFMGDAKISGSVGTATNVQKLDGDDTWLEYGIGANVKLTDKTYIWADVERTEGAEIEEEWRGTVGIRYSF